jgi:signal transduction histidine kinase
MYGRPAEANKTLVRVPELLEGVLRMARERLASNGISCRREFEAGGDTMVDPDMMRRAALNLVINAIEAMPNGGELRLSAGTRDDGKYAFVVEDTGVGIHEMNREKIFEPYFTTKPSGLGLGLILTKKIVDAHDGEILVDSEPGRGTRIQVVLPAEASREERP